MGGVTGPALLPARWRRVVLAVASVAFLAIGLRQASRDAPTVDEGVDVSSGLVAVVKHDLRMNPEHPVLPKAIASLPALLAHPIVPDTPAYRQGDWFTYSDDLIRANAEAGRLHDVLLWSRAVALLEGVACGLLLYRLAARFFGPDGGLLAALAWFTTPYVVGLSHTAMIDVPFVLATLGVLELTGRWLDRPGVGRTVALGAGLGAALATRHTALVLAVVVAALVVHHHRKAPRDAARDLGIVVLVSVVGLWLVYRGLAPTGSSSAVEARLQGLIDSQGGGSLPVRLIGALPLPLEWRAGFAYLDLTSTARPSYLLGHAWDGGRWWYFPISALVKLPLTLTAAVVGGWVLAVRGHRNRRALAALVAGPGVLLWLFLAAQPLNLGLRLALPVVALSFVGLGALAEPLTAAVRRLADRPRRPAGWALAGAGVVVALVQVAASAVAVPHSLAWTPPPWRPAYRWVSDANLDAGQAAYELRAWARSHQHPYVAYDTTRGLRVGGGSRSLTLVDPETVTGWVAVGVTPLVQTRRAELAWLRRWCPVGTLGGGAVLVYRFERPPGPTPGTARPAAPCFGAGWSTARD
jgi:4-amino-4-deoxy-L-arabinose transferase-like glycosyltransferase